MLSLALLTYVVLAVMLVIGLCLAAKKEMPVCAYVVTPRNRSPQERFAGLFGSGRRLEQRISRPRNLPCLLYAAKRCDGRCEDRICESSQRISQGKAIPA